MTDRERLDNIRLVIRATAKYLDKNKKSHFDMGDFWRGYNTGMNNLMCNIIEELDKKEDRDL